MSNFDQSSAQLGFDALLSDAESENRAHRIERETGHMPDTMEEGIAWFRDLIERNHEAVLAADVDAVTGFHEEARLLALKLNGGEPGILAHEDAPGYVLARQTAAPAGTVPRWGQQGEFIITLHDMRVHIELDGMFGIGAAYTFYPGFAARAVDPDKPFLSETGYRSFLGIYAEPQAGFQPDAFVARVIAAYIERELGGRLMTIGEEYR